MKTLLILTLAFLIGCASKSEQTEQSKAETKSVQENPHESMRGNPHRKDKIAPKATPNSASGLSWEIPAHWKIDASRSMRVATYQIDTETDCAVFYFGEGQGGDVQANIDRWVGQFAETDRTEPKVDKMVENGINITLLSLQGTFITGTMTGNPIPKPDFGMLAAVCESETGPVFFKITGPESEVKKSHEDFVSLLKSVKK